MKKNIIIKFVIAIFIFSCNTNKSYKIITFEHIKDIELPIEDTLFNVVYDYQYLKNESGEYLIVYLNNKEIIFYDIKTLKIVKKISLGQNPLLTFEYINDDSIFLFYNPAYNRFYMHDSSLLLINIKGDTIENYSWKGTPVWSWENPHYEKSEVAYSNLLFQKLPYFDNKIFINFDIYQKDYFFDSTYLFNKLPLVGYFNLKSNNFQSLDFYKYPNLDQTIEYPYDFSRIYLSKSKNNELLILFSYTPEFYIYKNTTKNFEKNNLESKLIDSIKIISNKSTDNNKYSYMVYDNENNYYYRFILLSQEEFGKNQYLAVVGDSDFKYVAEGLFPTNNSPKFVNFDNNILTVNYDKTYNNPGKIVFSVYKLKFSDINENQFNEYLPKIKDSISLCKLNYEKKVADRKIENFIESTKFFNDSNYLLIILPMNSCSSCLNIALNFIQMNSKLIFENNCKVLFSGNNSTHIKQLIKKHNLVIFEKNIEIDSAEIYYTYNQFDIINPRILIIENKKIIFDTVYLPDNMNNFQILIKNYVESKY